MFDNPDEGCVILRILGIAKRNFLGSTFTSTEKTVRIFTGFSQISFKILRIWNVAERLISENTDYTVVIQISEKIKVKYL